jgi:hypothetical protein
MEDFISGLAVSDFVGKNVPGLYPGVAAGGGLYLVSLLVPQLSDPQMVLTYWCYYSPPTTWFYSC